MSEVIEKGEVAIARKALWVAWAKLVASLVVLGVILGGAAIAFIMMSGV